MNIMAGVCLLIQGVWDIRTRQIPIWISAGFGACSFLYSICCQREWRSMCLALVPGFIFLVLAVISRQAVGYGDGLLLCSLGMLYSLEELIGICVIAMGFALLTALVLLGVFHKSGKYEIPFVPYLFLGWLLWYATCLKESGQL